MDTFINLMVEKTGIDPAMATKVIDFLKEHAAELPHLLSGNEGGGGFLSGLAGKASGLFGHKDEVAPVE